VVNWTWKQLHCDWRQIPAEQTDTVRTVLLHAVATRRLRQTPPKALKYPCWDILLPQLPPSGFNFDLLVITQTPHSYGQAWRTLALVLGADRRRTGYFKSGATFLTDSTSSVNVSVQSSNEKCMMQNLTFDRSALNTPVQHGHPSWGKWCERGRGNHITFSILKAAVIASNRQLMLSLASFPSCSTRSIVLSLR
jgi:hypothetical protein